MKSLTNYIKSDKSSLISLSEKLIINKDYDAYTYHPKTSEELREMITKRYKKQGPGTKNEPIDFNDIYISDIKLLNFDTTHIGIFAGMPYKYIDVSDWDVSNVKDISGLFSHCLEIKELDLSSWDVANVTDMYGMFDNCVNLQKLNIYNWDVSNVKDMSDMFNNCVNLQKLNIYNWDVSNVKDMSDMFRNCKEEIIPDWYKNKK